MVQMGKYIKQIYFVLEVAKKKITKVSIHTKLLNFSDSGKTSYKIILVFTPKKLKY